MPPLFDIIPFKVVHISQSIFKKSPCLHITLHASSSSAPRLEAHAYEWRKEDMGNMVRFLVISSLLCC